MFLLCNGIFAFLAKNLNLNTPARDNFNREDCIFNVEYDPNSSNASEVPEEIEIKVQGDRASQNATDEITENEIVYEDWNEDEDEDEDEDGDEDDEESESASVVSDMRVSTEELNKKFDEFIRKMKEEIRIEARQQYLIVV